MNLIKILFLFLFIIPSFIGCNNQKNQNDNSWNLVLRDGLLYSDSLANEPFTGHYKGKAMGKVIEYDVVDGKRDGIFAVYHENGNIETMGYLKENKNHGEWKYFYPNGIPESVGKFTDDQPDSVWNWFYMTGTLMQEGRFDSGKKEGEWKFYDDFGNLSAVLQYKDDIIIDSVFYSVNNSDKEIIIDSSVTN